MTTQEVNVTGYQTKPKKCAAPKCAATYIPHNWGTRKAQREGWFMQKNGDSWCPKHVPEWVEAWRASRDK
jgi:hypothetical protein